MVEKEMSSSSYSCYFINTLKMRFHWIGVCTSLKLWFLDICATLRAPDRMNIKHSELHTIVSWNIYSVCDQAKLPRGIEKIRPHLEQVDNVPLLVSLFTDCTVSTTREMIHIMQDCKEIVCVMGSSANADNVGIFLQANARWIHCHTFTPTSLVIPISH